MSEAVNLELAQKAAALKDFADKLKKEELAEKRRRADAWVNGYVATGAGSALVTAWIPGAATGILVALEGTMCYQIGRIYKHNFTMGEATATAAVVSLASLAGKFAALEGAILLGPFAFAVKPIIAGAIIKGIGQLVIKHFEDCA